MTTKRIKKMIDSSAETIRKRIEKEPEMLAFIREKGERLRQEAQNEKCEYNELCHKDCKRNYNCKDYKLYTSGGY